MTVINIADMARANDLGCVSAWVALGAAAEHEHRRFAPRNAARGSAISGHSWCSMHAVTHGEVAALQAGMADEVHVQPSNTH